MTKEEKNVICELIGSNAYNSQKQDVVRAMPESNSKSQIGTWKSLSFIDTLDQNGNLYIIHKVKCSNCRAVILLIDYDNYCPRCGSNNAFKE